MSRLLLFFMTIYIFLPSSFVFSQVDTTPAGDGLEILESDVKKQREDFWFCFGGDTALHSTYGSIYGGSFSFGFGSGSSVGFKAGWFFNNGDIYALEFNILLRFYFFKAAYSGPFFQIMSGHVIFNSSSKFSVLPDTGTFSGSLSFGWRFLFAGRFFIEPSIRGDYLHVFSAAVSAGIRF